MSRTYTVSYADPNDDQLIRHTKIDEGETLLIAAHKVGIAMEATCGARGRCRSCRIKVLNGEVPPSTIQDTVQLGHDDVREKFRLACQTKVIGNCTVMALPPKFESGHQILSSDAFAVKKHGLEIDSGIQKHVVQGSAPESEHNQTSDWEEILAVLPKSIVRQASLHVMRKIPTALRGEGGKMTITTFENRVIDIEPGDTSQQLFGMAFDIGTTSIVGSLIDLKTGECLSNVGGVNPQSIYGGDLMSRIAYAQFDSKKLATLRARVINTINSFVKESCSQAKVAREHVYKIVVVGNTCMHHVFLGIDVTYVGLAPYAPSVNDAVVISAGELPLKAAPNAQICLLPIVAGFVGADTMACVLSTRIYESTKIRALVDIGTNGEVIMGCKGRLMACSAPAGPALEGAQIYHGMRGSLGAVEKVFFENDDIAYSVIGDATPVGICGSGLVDACAKLVECGVMETSGRFCKKDREKLPSNLQERFLDTENGTQFILVRKEDTGKNEPITLTQQDIRQIQLAKSAIYSAIGMLQKIMGIPDDQLHELMMCGGFGNYINLEHAVQIRLVPNLPIEKITYSGNAALMGAQIALLSESDRLLASDLAQSIEHIGLATHPDFQELFIDGMSFSAKKDPLTNDSRTERNTKRRAERKGKRTELVD